MEDRTQATVLGVPVRVLSRRVVFRCLRCGDTHSMEWEEYLTEYVGRTLARAEPVGRVGTTEREADGPESLRGLGRGAGWDAPIGPIETPGLFDTPPRQRPTPRDERTNGLTPLMWGIVLVLVVGLLALVTLLMPVLLAVSR